MLGPHKWQHHFRGHVSRWTVPRDAILDLLSRTSKHVSAKDIYNTLQKIYPGIGLTTVYRTLDLLVRTRLINKLDIGEGQSRYEFKSTATTEHHHHLICKKCGKIINYSDFVDEELELVKKTEKSIAEKYNFQILDHNIEFYGICDTCK